MEDADRTEQVERTFAADPASVAAARSFVAEQIRGLPVDHPRVILLTSELVTNALVHARTPVIVRVKCDRIPIRVEVEDLSPEGPIILEAGPADTSGRGVRMVDLLAASWGWNLLPSGKRVWFEFGATPPDHE